MSINNPVQFTLDPSRIEKDFRTNGLTSLTVYGLRFSYGYIHNTINISDDGLYEIRVDTRRSWSTGTRAHKFAARGGFVKTGVPLTSIGLILFKDKSHAEQWIKAQYIELHEKEKEVMVTIQQNKDYLSSYVLS